MDLADELERELFLSRESAENEGELLDYKLSSDELYLSHTQLYRV